MFRGRFLKAVLLLVAMGAVLTVSTVSASPAHRHTEAIGGDCNLCCVGHLPALQSPRLLDIRPSVVLAYQRPASEYFSVLDPQFSATFGRAPPV